MKKLATLMVVVLMLAAFAGCDNQLTPTERVRPSESAVATSEQVSETVPVTTEASVAATTEAPQEEVDPIAIYMASVKEGNNFTVSAEYCAFFMKRGDNLYTLGSKIKERPDVNYYAGKMDRGDVVFVETARNEYPSSYEHIQEVFMYSGLPIMEIRDSDQFVSVASSGDIPTLYYATVSSMRYTVDREANDSVYSNNMFKMTDSHGDVIAPEQYGDLEYGETYVLSWYEGTVYHEERRIADAIYVTARYKYDEQLFHGRLTKQGYATYNVNLEPGLYLLWDRLVRIS